MIEVKAKCDGFACSDEITIEDFDFMEDEIESQGWETIDYREYCEKCAVKVNEEKL